MAAVHQAVLRLTALAPVMARPSERGRSRAERAAGTVRACRTIGCHPALRVPRRNDRRPSPPVARALQASLFAEGLLPGAFHENEVAVGVPLRALSAGSGW